MSIASSVIIETTNTQPDNNQISDITPTVTWNAFGNRRNTTQRMVKDVRVTLWRCVKGEIPEKPCATFSYSGKLAEYMGLDKYARTKTETLAKTLGTTNIMFDVGFVKDEPYEELMLEEAESVSSMITKFAASSDDYFVFGHTTQTDSITHIDLGVVYERVKQGKVTHAPVEDTAPGGRSTTNEGTEDSDNEKGGNRRRGKKKEGWHNVAMSTFYQYGIFYPEVGEDNKPHSHAGQTLDVYDMSDPLTEKSVHAMIGKVMMVCWTLHTKGNTVLGVLPDTGQIHKKIKEYANAFTHSKQTHT